MTERRKTATHYAIAWLAFLAAAGVKNPRPLLEPRFWAEEGPEYFAPLQGVSFFDAVVYVYRGNFQLLTNLLAKLATYVPIETAPFVTTYASLLIASVLPLLLCRIVLERGGPPVAAWVGALLFGLLHMTFEVYLTATNIQWVCGASVFLLLFATLPSKTLAGLALGWIVACGLTGVPSVIFAPAFCLLGWARASRFHLMSGAALSLAAVVQIAVVVSHEHGGRELVADPLVLLLPTALQGVLGVWLSADTTAAIGQATGLAPVAASALLAMAFIVAALVGLSRCRWLAVSILLVGLGVGVFQTFVALGNPRDFIGGAAGGRYYFVPAVAVVLAVTLCKGRVGPALLAWAAAVHVIAAALGGWSTFLDGPSWRDQVAKCPPNGCQVQVWPAGYQPTATIFLGARGTEAEQGGDMPLTQQ